MLTNIKQPHFLIIVITVIVISSFSSAVLAKKMAYTRKELKEVAADMANKYGMPVVLMHALITVESSWQPRAISKKGAMGLMQLMPATADRFDVQDAYDPYQNLDGGMRYFRFLLNRFQGRLDLALAAYNAGEHAVDRYNGIPPYPETQAYVHKVLKLYGAPASPVRSVRRIRSYHLMRTM
jgi:soluble lytic murein transglycosylase-like protein